MSAAAASPTWAPPRRARLAIGLATAGEELAATLERRLAREFGAPMERWTEAAPGAPRRWLLHADPVDPARLAAVQAHLQRVADLYPDARPRPVLTAALVDPLRVTRAADADAPAAIYLGQGVWAEVAMIWSQGAGWCALAWTPAAWLGAEGQAFWTGARLAAMETRSAAGR